MAQVTNTSHDELAVPLLGLIFGPGEMIDVDDADAEYFGWPFDVVKSIPAPAAPSAPVPVPAEQPAEQPAAPAEGSAQ